MTPSSADSWLDRKQDEDDSKTVSDFGNFGEMTVSDFGNFGEMTADPSLFAWRMILSSELVRR
ncbi:hypothetical protein AALP_AAs60000U000100, partial [Arabis alpina]